MGLSIANNARTANKVLQNVNGNNNNNNGKGLLGRALQNQQPAKKFLRRR
jgi:hypothetical protein